MTQNPNQLVSRLGFAALVLVVLAGCSSRTTGSARGGAAGAEEPVVSAGNGAGAVGGAGAAGGGGAATSGGGAAGVSGGTSAGAGPDEVAGTQVFRQDMVHVIEIVVADEWLDELEPFGERPPSDERVPGKLTFDGVPVENVGLRVKGQASREPLSGKPPFSVKLDAFVAGQRLDGLRRLSLNNAKQDPTFFHELCGYELYALAGLPAPRVAFARLSFNGVDKGVYVIREAYNKEFLQQHFGKEADQGNLYEGGTDFAGMPGAWQALELDDELEESRSRADLQALAAAVSDAAAADLLAALDPLVDLDGFMTGYAVDAIAGHWDGFAFGTNNYYLYHHPSTDRFVVLPHGMDQLFEDANADAFAVGPNVVGNGPALMAERLRALPEWDTAFRARVATVAQQHLDPAYFEAKLEAILELLEAVDATQLERTSVDISQMSSNLPQLLSVLAARRALLASP